MCKMQEDDVLLNRVNKVKTLANQLICLEVPVKNKYIDMILHKNLSMSYEYLITVMETMMMKKLMMNYVTICLMYEMLKRKENEPQNKDDVMMLQQNKYNNLFLRQGVKLCFYCGKSGYIARFCC